jgi:hypothetical protein
MASIHQAEAENDRALIRELFCEHLPEFQQTSTPFA